MALTLHGTVSDNTAVLSRPNAKPLIINGDMNIAQRATSVTGHTGGGITTLDRWRFDVNTLGTWTIAQTASGPGDTGLTNSFRVDCTTADASPAAGDYAIYGTRLEGQDVQLFKKGTSSAEKMTVSFWVKSNKTGTYIMEIDDNDNARNINQAYTISSADTWEKKVLTFDGDTTGAFGNDNGDSLRLLWWLGAGSNFTSGSLQTAWAGTDNTKRAVGNVNVGDNTANDWSITGIQMEVGDFDANSIAPFQHESFGDNLSRCQRYYQRLLESQNVYFAGGWYYTAGNVIGFKDLVTTMRTTPTLICATVTNGYTFYRVSNPDHVNSLALNSASSTNIAITNTSEVSGTAGDAGGWYCSSASSQLDCTAEL